MKRTKIIGRNNNTGTTTVITTADDDNDNDNDEKLTFFETFSTLMAQDWFRIVVAIVVTPIVYYVIVAILPDAAYWLKHLIALGLSLLFLIFINSALKKSGKDGVGKAIAVGVILLFCFHMACHYLGKENQSDDKDPNVPAQVVDPVASISAVGSYPMRLSQGQTSDWIEVDPALSYRFSNPNSTFYLTYEDGSIAKSWGPGNWPKKYKFKVTSLSNEQFNLITE